MIHVLILVRHAAAYRDHIADAPVLGVYRRENVVEQGALVVIGVVDVRLEREQRPRELQHVVGIASLARAPVHAVVQVIRRPEILVGAVAPAREAVVLGHAIPEERGREEIGGLTGVAVALGGADELGHLGVAMLAGEIVLVALERRDERAVLERVRKLEPALVSRVGVEVHEHLVHPAELGVHHVLELLVAELRENALGPCRELPFHLECQAVAGVAVGVPQARVRFVERIPGRPQAVEVERGRAYLALCEARERLAPALEGAQVAIAVLVLDLLQLPYDVIGSGLEARVACRREHETHG